MERREPALIVKDESCDDKKRDASDGKDHVVVDDSRHQHADHTCDKRRKSGLPRSLPHYPARNEAESHKEQVEIGKRHGFYDAVGGEHTENGSQPAKDDGMVYRDSVYRIFFTFNIQTLVPSNMYIRIPRI